MFGGMIVAGVLEVCVDIVLELFGWSVYDVMPMYISFGE